jgi:hypothetical protein
MFATKKCDKTWCVCVYEDKHAPVCMEFPRLVHYSMRKHVHSTCSAPVVSSSYLSLAIQVWVAIICTLVLCLRARYACARAWFCNIIQKKNIQNYEFIYLFFINFVRLYVSNYVLRNRCSYWLRYVYTLYIYCTVEL